jgi:hypothetical protein
MDSLIFKYVYNLLRISLLKARFILMERIYIIAQDKPIHLCPPLLWMAMLCSHLVDMGFHFLLQKLHQRSMARRHSTHLLHLVGISSMDDLMRGDVAETMTGVFLV